MKKTQIIETFDIIGISVRTSNHDNMAIKDIPALWQRFVEENVAANIPNKIDDTLYCVYTNYEGDFTQPYDTILGCKVSSLDEIPQGMISHTITGGSYQAFLAEGNLQQGAVVNTWKEIWASPIARSYTSDYEVYDTRAQNPIEAQVPIFISVKS